jgi:hypothetical protein
LAPNGQRQDTKYWYKISLDAVRAWTTVVVVLVVAVAAVWGYTLLSRHLLERAVVVAIEESETLLVRLRSERGISAHRDRLGLAAERLDEAKEFFAAEQLAEARTEAERSRTMLISISDALRHRGPSGEAQFIAVQGSVEVRRGERGEWRPARSRMELNPGDYVKTGPNGSAEGMMVDGTLFTVRPNTVLLVARSRSVPGVRSERTLSLESGWVNLSTAETASRITTPDAEARVGERSDAVVAYDEQERRGSFSNYRGDLKIASADGTEREVGELQLVVQSDDSLSRAMSLPVAPVPGSPEDNSEFTLSSSETIVLEWEPVRGAAGYALQVSQSRLFVDNIIDVEGRTKTAATLGVKGAGSFVWRVAAENRNGQHGPWSKVNRFRVAGDRSADESTPDESPSQEG